MSGRRLTGIAAIILAVGFNLPYAALAVIYDYPAVLRRPPGEALELFLAGGPWLVLAWEGFMLAALALIPLSSALAMTSGRITERPALAVGAAISGALAGLTQAIGLSRWVFVVPGLARDHAETATRLAAEQAFALLNAWGGVAIGEHLGQLLTSLFILQMATLQGYEGSRRTAAAGGLTTVLIFAGSGEGLAMAMGRSSEVFSWATTAGFVMLTVWLIVTGVGLIRTSSSIKG